MSNGTKRSPWVYIGCSCAVLAGLIIIGVVVAGVMGVRTFQQFAEDMNDPVARAERANELLGSNALPAGYHAQMSFSVPYVMDMVMLTDGEPVTEANDEGMREFENMLFFVKIRNFDEAKDFDRYLEGEIDRPEIFDQIDVNMDLNFRKPVARGRFAIGDQQVRWVAQTGEMDVDHGEVEGIVSLAGIECPQEDKRVRILVWFQRQDAIDLEALRSDPQGTPADGDAFQSLMQSFDVCVE